MSGRRPTGSADAHPGLRIRADDPPLSDEEAHARALRWAAAEDRRLARSLGIPRGTAVRWTPLMPGEAMGSRWAGWTVQMFGEVADDGPTDTERFVWPGWAVYGDDGAPILSVRAWLQRIRPPDFLAYIEARRDDMGNWDVSIANLGSKPTVEDVRKLLPGLSLLRRLVARAGGRPTGSGKRLDEVREALALWRKAKGKPDGCPPAYVLGNMLRPPVAAETARKYLRQLRAEVATKPGK